MKGKQQDFRTEKYIRYGIRKYSFGAASVAIAAGLMFLGNGAVSATEQNPVSDAKENIQKVEKASSELGTSTIQLTEKTAETPKKEEVKADWNIFTKDVEGEFHVTDTDMVWNLQSTEANKVLPKQVSHNVILALQAVDNGPLTNCQDEALAYMVETSSNVASIHISEDTVTVVSSQRSNVMSNLVNMTNTVKACFELAGAEVLVEDSYPAWKMNPNSELVNVAVEQYHKLFGKKPRVLGIHAGLECGLFSEKYPNLDMISFGPTLRYVHTPDERLLIPTVQMVWDHLLAILKNID